MKPILIVISPYYEAISAQLLKGATTAITAAGRTHETVNVPGAFEIPAAVRLAIASERYSAYVALGCVIRGETSHYDTVCGESARGLQQLALEHGAAIGYGILTVETMEQAKIRADVAQGNKGGEAVAAALAVLELRNIFGLEGV